MVTLPAYFASYRNRDPKHNVGYVSNVNRDPKDNVGQGGSGAYVASNGNRDPTGNVDQPTPHADVESNGNRDLKNNPLAESCLPENVLCAWERSRSVEDSSPQDSARSLDKLLCFLRNEVQSEEMIKLARTGLGASRVSHPRSHPDEADFSTAAALVNFQGNSGRRNFRCIFCDKPHNSSECFSARKLPLEEKRKLLVQKHACFRCLKTGHVSRSCKYKVKCLSCDKNHYTIMCADKESAKSNDENTIVSSSVLSNQSVNKTVYLQTLVLRIEHNDAIGITDPTEDAKRKHAHFDFLNQFKENLSVLPDGRYQLPLPFKFETQLRNNKSATFKRHQRMCQRIDEQNLLNEYEVVFRQWEDLQIIEEVPKTEVDNFGYYLPHRPVMKQASQTMKIRPVFDASARDKNQPSLNDCLNRGPNLIELIPDIIDRFRLYPIGLSSDIEKAFLQLSIIPEHRDYLRFFLPNIEESKIYRHCRVVFGICSSPFQLSACIDHLLENSPARFDDVT
ncbi:integrase catalytic domain-containing protein [Trichonephila clavipes]|nr:integrase catalytic domain-containing protein [Trichonephila clavipes]